MKNKTRSNQEKQKVELHARNFAAPLDSHRLPPGMITAPKTIRHLDTHFSASSISNDEKTWNGPFWDRRSSAIAAVSTPMFAKTYALFARSVEDLHNPFFFSEAQRVDKWITRKALLFKNCVSFLRACLDIQLLKLNLTNIKINKLAFLLPIIYNITIQIMKVEPTG